MRLGEILVGRKMLTPDQVEQFLHLAGKQLLHCPTCAKNYNVKNWKPGREVFCPTCRMALVPPASDRTLDARDSRQLPASAADVRDQDGKPFGRYRLLDELGHGGMGIVWKAWDTNLKRIVALKQILAGGEIDAAAIERFMREAQLAARLAHPNIVPVHDVGVHDGQHFFTTEYIVAQPLDRVMKKRVPVKQALGWVKAVAEALAYAHEQGVVHRDVKPANILIDGHGRPHVMDFGLAKDVDLAGAGGKGRELTRSGALLGTPKYMSPEQASGGEILGSTDQFSLGVVLYELITHHAPFTGRGLRELLNAIIEQEPSRPTKLNPRLHRDVETICLKAIEKAPTRRYSTIGDFAADVGRALDGEPIHAQPISTAQRVWRKTVKHRAIVLPTAAAVLIGIAFIGWAVYGSMRKSEEVARAISKAQQAESDGRDDDARNSYREALAIDPHNTVAATGRDRVEARLAEANAARDKSAKEAEAEANARRIALEKAGLVQNVFARFLAHAEMLKKMERTFYDDRLSTEEKRRSGDDLWPAFEEFIEHTPPDNTSQSAMRAFAGWARRLGGYEDEGLGWMKQAQDLDRDLPYGSLMEALVHLSEYLAQQPLPQIATGGPDIVLGPSPEETAEMRVVRERMEGLTAQVANAAVWGEGIAQEFRAFVEAIGAMQDGLYAEAEAKLSSLMGSSIAVLFRNDLLFMRARLQYLLARFDEGLAQMKGVAEVRSGHSPVHLHLAYLSRGAAEKREARGEDAGWLIDTTIVHCDEALRLNPRYAEAFVERGLAYAGKGALERAISDYDEALKINPRDTDALGNRGYARHEKGDLSGAISDYGEALKINSRDPILLNNRGNVRLAMGDLDGAITDFDEALGINPQLAIAYVSRGAAHQEMGDLAGAIADYAEALKISPKFAEAFYSRAMARMAQGDLEGTLADCDEALRINPRFAFALVIRGSVRAAKKDYDGAIADCNEALKVNPRLAEAYMNRGVARRAKGDVAGGYEDLDKALEINPNLAAAYGTRAGARHSDGDVEGALTDFDRAVALKPRDATTLMGRGYARYMSGDLAGAAADLEMALEVAPSGWPYRQGMENALKAVREQMDR